MFLSAALKNAKATRFLQGRYSIAFAGNVDGFVRLLCWVGLLVSFPGVTFAADCDCVCPVDIITGLDSRTAGTETLVRARLKQSLRLTQNYNAPPGSIVTGHVSEVTAQRRQIKSYTTRQRWGNADACMAIVFDELTGLDGKHFRIDAHLAKQKTSVPLSSGHVRVYAVNKSGQIVHAKESLATSVQVANSVGQFGLSTAATIAGGPVGSFVIAPVVLGIAGAISPSFVTNRPVTEEQAHPRWKGMTVGAFSGLPGSGLVGPFIFKGENLTLLPGQEMLISCKAFNKNTLPASAGYSLSYGYPLAAAR